jgi:hypothetical protein
MIRPRESAGGVPFSSESSLRTTGYRRNWDIANCSDLNSSDLGLYEAFKEAIKEQRLLWGFDFGKYIVQRTHSDLAALHA